MRPLLPYCAGAVLGGTAGAAVVVVVTTIIKESLAAISGAEPWLLLTLPVVGVALATVVLHVIGHGEPVQRLDPPDRADADPAPPAAPRPRRRWIRWTRRLPRIPAAWATFPADVARADLTGDVVASAGAEEQFPWRQAPLRAVAIVLTVGLGAPMGTEAPAAHLGVATGSWIGQTRPALRRMQRGAAIAGGAAGVSALMGVALVGTVFMLELGRRRRIPLSAPRVAAALVGGLLGWAVNTVFRLDLIRLIVPNEPPADVAQAIQTCLFVGVASGVLTAVAGWAIHSARDWRAGPWRRLMIGAAARQRPRRSCSSSQTREPGSAPEAVRSCGPRARPGPRNQLWSYFWSPFSGLSPPPPRSPPAAAEAYSFRSWRSVIWRLGRLPPTSGSPVTSRGRREPRRVSPVATACRGPLW